MVSSAAPLLSRQPLFAWSRCLRAFRVRTVAVLRYDVGMSENKNTAHRPAVPSPSAVAASMNAGHHKNANGRGNNSNGGDRRNSGKRRPLALRPFDELAARYSQDALAAGRDLFVTFLREAWADRRTGNRVYYSRETTLDGKTFVPFMHAYRQWWAGDGEFADGGDLADTRAGWRAGDNARTKVSRAVYQKLRNARGLTGEEDMYRVAYAWRGNYPEKPSIGTHVLYNDGDTAYTLCRVLTGPNAHEVAQAIVRDTTGENGESWFIPVMQRLYDAGKHGIAKSGVFRSIARSYGVSTSQEAEKAITSYESFIEDCENNDGKNVKRLLGSGRLTPRIAAMARAAHEQLGCSGYYGKSLWLEIEARRDTWCDTDKKRAEFVSALFDFASPEQALNWWWHANKYDAGYSHHGYGAYRENQGHYEMRWYADVYDQEARKRYPVGSAAFARLYNAGGAGMDKYKARGLEALGCTLSDDDLYALFKRVGGTTWHCGDAPFSERLWMEHVTNGGELTRLREVAENDGAMRVVTRGGHVSGHDWAFLVRHMEQFDSCDDDVQWLFNRGDVDMDGVSWSGAVLGALWARYDTQGREGMRHLFALLGLGDEDGLIDLGELPYGLWAGMGKRPTLDLAYQDAPEAANLWLGVFPYDKFGFSHRDNVRTWANTLTDDEKSLLNSLPTELREAWDHLAAGDGEVGYIFRWEHDYGDDSLNASAAFAVAMTTGHVGADMMSWLGDNDGVRAFMLAHASSMFSPEFPWTADWGRGVHSVPWWVTKGMSGMARAAFLHDVKDSDYMVGVYRDEWIVEAGDAADADARMAGIRKRVGGISAKVSVGYGVRAFRGRDADKVMVPAGWMQAELAGYWGCMDGLDARTVFARDFLNALRADLASDVSDEARFPDGFFALCVPEARKAVEADMARGALDAVDGKVMLEELDEVLELNL